ncbi:MAG: HNH endonuclease signature motif containing protein [Candidatus Bathyarchaeota archaeon]|nr:HNH endonuclease signature motif containing protein [Candidatus Bathyarchaeota archaeon]
MRRLFRRARPRRARYQRPFQYSQPQRSCLLGPEYPPNWDEWSQWAKKRAGNRCQLCGTPKMPGVTLVTHHRYPASKGGPTTPENLIVLCERCHASQHKHLYTRYVNKYYRQHYQQTYPTPQQYYQRPPY